MGKSGEFWGIVEDVGKTGGVCQNKGHTLAPFTKATEVTHCKESMTLAMFLGEYEHSIDAKGRLAIPAKFRARMDRGAVISKGMGTCLSIYTLEHWEQKSNELAAGMASEELRDFERRIYPSASEVELDAQGRIVIPAKLRAFAKLETDATITGVRNHIEIWDRVTWLAYQEQLESGGSRIPF